MLLLSAIRQLLEPLIGTVCIQCRKWADVAKGIGNEVGPTSIVRGQQQGVPHNIQVGSRFTGPPIYWAKWLPLKIPVNRSPAELNIISI